MSTKTWLILKNGKSIVCDGRETYDCCFGYTKSPTVYTSYDAALSAAKKLASKNIEDYTIFGSETITAVKTPDVDVIAVVAPPVVS